MSLTTLGFQSEDKLGTKDGEILYPLNAGSVFMLLGNCQATIVEAEYLKYKDPKQPLNGRIKDLMNQLTLEEKIGQIIGVRVVTNRN